MFKSILLPIDLADDGSWEKALPVAKELAKDYGAKLHVVSVLPDFGMSIVSSYFKEGYEDEALKDFGQQLTEWVNRHVPKGIAVHPHVLHGSVYHQIMSAADKLSCDLIVLASHRPELKDYLLGPNAARVVRHAKQSVMIVRD